MRMKVRIRLVCKRHPPTSSAEWWSWLDVINVGNSGAIGTPGLLTPIPGAVTVNGGTDGANLVVDGSGAAVAADYTITSTTVTRSLQLALVE